MSHQASIRMASGKTNCFFLFELDDAVRRCLARHLPGVCCFFYENLRHEWRSIFKGCSFLSSLKGQHNPLEILLSLNHPLHPLHLLHLLHLDSFLPLHHLCSAYQICDTPALCTLVLCTLSIFIILPLQSSVKPIPNS